MKCRRICALSLALIFAASMLLAGCGGGAGQSSEKLLRTANGAEPETLDPRLAIGTPEGIVLRQIFEGLCTQDKNGDPVPGQAEKWEISADGLTYKFFLRPGLKWSNGDPLTAKDFEFAWKTLLSPEFGSKYAEQLYYLKNGAAYNKGTAKADDVGVKAIDDRTLEVKLEKPTPYFLFLTSFWSYFPVPQKVVEANPKWHADAKTLVGNGPFKAVNWAHTDKIELVKNENYWNKGVVKLDKIMISLSENNKTVLDMFENKQLDTAEVVPPLSEVPRLLKEDKLKTGPYIGNYYYCINVTKPPFDNVKVRKAFALAIDRKAIVEQITKAGELPALAWAPNGFTDAKPGEDFRKVGGDYFKDNDIATAKQLLAEAGYPDGKGLPPITILYNTAESHKVIAEAIQEMWKKNLGVNVNITNQEWKVYLASRSTGDYQLARSAWIGDYLDPMTFMDTLTSKNGNNHTRWGNAEYDRLVQQVAQMSSDQAVRMKAMHDAEKILMDDMPVLPIYFYVNRYLESPNVKGVIHDALGAVYYREATIE
ncbi:MAG TPA: peptide ABC transporter substrate-binding protein [Selenomonadales bacterium]|nr:peptide ABC transporter substrate-binding protein [Selenomonadales bacterium]